MAALGIRGVRLNLETNTAGRFDPADAKAVRLAPLPVWLASEPWVQRLHRKEGGVPYGIALAAAALAIYPDTPWMAFAM